jgi:hypothetical protein
VGRHLRQKLDHLPLLGDLGRDVGVVTAIRQSRLPHGHDLVALITS